jgi:hypothetical protein
MAECGTERPASLYAQVGSWSKRPLEERWRRYDEIHHLSRGGMSLRAIAAYMAAVYGTPMSAERVRQILLAGRPRARPEPEADRQRREIAILHRRMQSWSSHATPKAAARVAEYARQLSDLLAE